MVTTLSVSHSSYVSYAFLPEHFTLNFDIQHLKKKMHSCVCFSKCQTLQNIWSLARWIDLVKPLRTTRSLAAGYVRSYLEVCERCIKDARHAWGLNTTHMICHTVASAEPTFSHAQLWNNVIHRRNRIASLTFHGLVIVMEVHKLLIRWLNPQVLPIVFTTECRVISYNLLWTFVFYGVILWFPPNHTPIKYKDPIMKRNRVTSALFRLGIQRWMGDTVALSFS